jgi:hypothetical protein
MYKLLTEQEKQIVKKEYNLHRLVIMLLALVVVLSVALVGLLPSYLFSTVRHREIGEQLEILRPAEGSEEASLKTWLAETNKKIGSLSPELDKDTVSQYFDKLIQSKPAGISVKRLGWKKSADKVAISIQGVARDRQALINYEKALSSSGEWADVVLPVSNLASDRNIEFDISLSPR